MKLGMIATAALALGVSAATPMVTKADGWHRGRDESREVRRDYREEVRHDSERRYDRPVYREEIRHDLERVYERPVYQERSTVRDIALCDVPGCVSDRVNDYRHGRRIETAQLVCENGHDFYQFRIDDRNGDFTLQIEPNGHLFGRVDR